MNPTAILTGDWHLTDKQPIARTDNYWEIQWKKVNFIKDLQIKYNCPILHAGDMFHKYTTNSKLINEAIHYLPNNIILVAGNHDLRNHNMELIEESAISTLWKVFQDGINIMRLPCNEIIWGEIQVNGFSWNQELKNIKKEKGIKKHICLTHTYTYKKKLDYPGMKAIEGSNLLKQYPEYDLIITGHNHQGFVIEKDDRLLVNPGSIMRQHADQADYKPRIYLWYAKDNSIEAIYLPIKSGVISREHLIKKQERDERLNNFVSRLITDEDIDLSFERNVEILMNKPNVRKPVKQMTEESLEHGINRL
jgi:predicted phosphodiesterase